MFPHRKPCDAARRAMAQAAELIDVKRDAELIQRAEEAIRKLTHHEFAVPVASGSCATLAVLSAVKGKVMLPDQGGWRGFERCANLLGREVCTLKTKLGVVEQENLAEALRQHKPEALIVTSFAGYMAEQDMRAIHETCVEHGVLLVEDASPAIGDDRLAKGENADVIICSTGDPKIANLTSGGFISTSDEEILKRAKVAIRACRISGILAAGMVEELKVAPLALKRLVELSSQLKRRFMNVVHPNRRGVCVGVLHPQPKQVAQRARSLGLYTDLGKSLITVCPNRDRFLEKGVCIELKKLDVFRMSRESVSALAEKLEEALT